LEGVTAEPVEKKLRRYKSNWQQENAKNNVELYRPNRCRQIGRPLKRLLDEAETGLSRPNS
jgi:hypothetical protein